MMFIFNFVVISLAASVCVQAETESEIIYVPPYTTLLGDTILAIVVLGGDLTLTGPDVPDVLMPLRDETLVFFQHNKKRTPSNNQSAEFLKIYIAVIDLADQVAEKGEHAYPEFYMETATKAMKQVIDNPVDAEHKLWNHVQNTSKELKKMSFFVLYKQLAECMQLLSYECDLLIQSGMKDDPDLKQRADLLVAGGKQAKKFMEISDHIKTASESGYYDAEKFLLTGSAVMKPLVLAAYQTQKVLHSLKL